MAEDIGSLYVRLGLDISELETGFVAVGRTVNENVRRLNRESDLVRLRSEVEITGLDETADAARILEIRQESLNRQMEIQRDRVRILTAELQNLTDAHGSEAVITQRAAIRLERERLALAQLERDLRNIGDTQEETNSLFDELADLLPPIPTKLQAIGIAAGAVASGFGAAGAAVSELLEDFRELQTQAYELNLPFDATKNLLRDLKLAGGDIGDFEGYIRGITDAYVKGEYDDPEFIALRRYGAEITDTTGKLKNFAEISDEVFKAWEKAEAEGNGIEFLQLTGGESGIRDAIQLFKRLKEAREDAAKIYDANLDADQLHELDRAFALVEEQAKELKNAIGNIFVPAAQAAAEKLFQALHDGTEYLVENKDAIQRWGFIADEVFSTVADKVKKGYTAVGEFIEEAMKPKNTTGNEKVDNMMSGMAWRYGSAQTPYGVEKMKSGITEATESYGVFNEAVERAEKRHEEYNAELAKTAESLDTLDKQLDKNPLNQYAVTRIQGFKDELEDLRLELDFEDEFERARAQVDLWLKREIDRKNFLSDEEEAAIRELGKAKLEQIDRAQKTAFEALAEKAQQYWKDAADIEYDLTHTAFEKQLRDIELWKNAQQEKAETAEEIAGIIANAAAKEAEAFENAVDRIKGKIQTLEDKIFEIDHSQYENDLRKIQQEYIRMAEDLQKEGVFDEATKARLDYLYSRQKANLDRRAAESRKTDGDYTKSPEGSMQGGGNGNGIMVISGDQIIDDGLKQSQRQAIGLMTDENRIRSMLAQNLNDESKALAERIQAEKELTDTQKLLVQSAEQAASGFELIEGDKFANAPQPSASGIELIEGERVIPTAELQAFGDALQQTALEIEQADPLQALAEKQAALSESTDEVTTAQKTLADAVNQFPAEYLKNLADGAKSVSDMQLGLTNSTMELIDAQSKLRDALNNLPNLQSLQTNKPVDGLTNVAFNRTRELEELPVSRRQKSGVELGFDMDTAGTVLGLGALVAGIGGATMTAPVAAGIAVLSALGGLAKGTYDESMADRGGTTPSVDFSGIITPLQSIDEKVQSVLDEMQNSSQTDSLQELFGALPNIEAYVKDISTALQDSLSFETVVTPLNSISGFVEQILSAVQEREPPQVNVSPNINIDLGGAYVFDNAMKTSLTTEITNEVAAAITEAVQQATSTSNYSFGA